MQPLSAARVRALHRLRYQFGRGPAAEKAAHLAACSGGALTNPRVALQYHETLLFMAAHPDSRSQLATINLELDRFTASGPALHRSGAGRKLLKACGLAGGHIEASFSIRLLEWLLEHSPGDVALAWEAGSAGADLDDLLALTVLPPERDGRIHPRFDMRRWLDFASGSDGSPEAELRWVIDRVRDFVPDPELRDLVADCVALRVRWELSGPALTRTHARFAPRPLFLQSGPVRRRFQVAALLRRPLPAPEPLSRTGIRQLIDVARGVLAVREREADPVTYASRRETTLFRLERGIDVALFGQEPRRRLPIDAYFGYVAARNRVPIAYGGAWIVDRRAEIGIHLFETFRGGESAYLFAQILRTYRFHYDVTRFQVDPYQFGADNPEAIRSGAFWFYYRFGFRPRDVALAQLAADEWESIRRDRTHRTAAPMLRRFTKSPLILDFETRAPAPTPPDPTRLGIAVTESIRTNFESDRAAAQRWAVRRMIRQLPVGSRRAWPEEERRAFDRLCPLMALLPGLERWPAADRRALVRVMRAKGGPRERDFVLRVQRHPRLRDALLHVEAAVDWDHVPARPRWRQGG